MNPILLKPSSDRTSQVIVLGEPQGHLDAVDYHAAKPALRQTVLDALGRLRSRFDVVLLEGAGSPAEINLLDADLVNLWLADAAGIPAVVVGDIDRGGVFASLFGTVTLLPDHLRSCVQAFVINKFRGDPALLTPGLADLEARTGVPTRRRAPLGRRPPPRRRGQPGAAPTLGRRRRRPASAAGGDTLDVAVIRFPRISNFTDMDALALERRVHVRYVTHPAGLGDPDLVILPGTKATVADLAWLRGRGFEPALRALELSTTVLGICGGYQMLGRRIDDRFESGSGVSAGSAACRPRPTSKRPRSPGRGAARQRCRSRRATPAPSGERLPDPPRPHDVRRARGSRWPTNGEPNPTARPTQEARSSAPASTACSSRIPSAARSSPPSPTGGARPTPPPESRSPPPAPPSSTGWPTWWRPTSTWPPSTSSSPPARRSQPRCLPGPSLLRSERDPLPLDRRHRDPRPPGGDRDAARRLPARPGRGHRPPWAPPRVWMASTPSSCGSSAGGGPGRSRSTPWPPPAPAAISPSWPSAASRRSTRNSPPPPPSGPVSSPPRSPTSSTAARPTRPTCCGSWPTRCSAPHRPTATTPRSPSPTRASTGAAPTTPASTRPGRPWASSSTGRTSWPGTPPSSTTCARPSRSGAPTPLACWCYSLRPDERGDVPVVSRLPRRPGRRRRHHRAGHGPGSGAGRRLAASRTSDSWDVPVLARLDVPVVQAVAATTSRAAWEENDVGLSPLDTAWSVALPEFDGRIVSVPLSFKEIVDDGDDLGLPVVAYRTVPDRVARVAGTAARLAALRRTPNADKKIAVVLSAYPTKRGRIGNAVGLDTPASVIGLLHSLRAAGYRVDDIPADGDTLMAELIDRFSYEKESLTTAQLERAVGAVSAADYAAWFAELPKPLRDNVVEHWGEPPGSVYLHDGAIRLAGLDLGHVLVMVQPPRGFGENPIAVYHSPDLPPTHHYLAAYRWLDRSWGADAVVHVGKHGNLEWLPGKGVGLSAACGPDAALGDLPLVYPFVVNDPGEGTQAKRRAHAVIIDHLVPPMTRAEVYDDLARLERLLDEYYQVSTLDPAKLPTLRAQIWELCERAALDHDLERNGRPRRRRLRRLPPPPRRLPLRAEGRPDPRRPPHPRPPARRRRRDRPPGRPAPPPPGPGPLAAAAVADGLGLDLRCAAGRTRSPSRPRPSDACTDHGWATASDAIDTVDAEAKRLCREAAPTGYSGDGGSGGAHWRSAIGIDAGTGATRSGGRCGSPGGARAAVAADDRRDREHAAGVGRAVRARRAVGGADPGHGPRAADGAELLLRRPEDAADPGGVGRRPPAGRRRLRPPPRPRPANGRHRSASSCGAPPPCAPTATTSPRPSPSSAPGRCGPRSRAGSPAWSPSPWRSSAGPAST